MKRSAPAHLQSPSNAEGKQQVESDEDYMSDLFLQTVESRTEKNLEALTYSERRRKVQRLSEQKQEENRALPRRQLEEKERARGLNTPITADNKGFQLLQRMGFRPGDALGVREKWTDEAAPSGISPRTEPISLPCRIPTGKAGLGLESTASKQLPESQISDQGVAKEIWEKAYQERLKDHTRAQRVKADLKKARTACEDLDIQKGWIDGKMYWLSEVARRQELFGDPSTKDDDDFALLHEINSYIRNRHFYCIWCGGQFSDMNDMSQHCPGESFEVHDDE